MPQGSSAVKPLWWASFLCSARWVDGIVPMLHEDPPKLEVKGDPDSTLFHPIPPDLNYLPNGYTVNLFRTTHRKRVLPTQDPVSLQRCGSRANSCERPLRSKSHQGRWGGARAQNIHVQARKQIWKPRHEQRPFSMSLPSCSKKQGNPILSHILYIYINIYIYIMFPKKTTKKIIIQQLDGFLHV